MKIKSLFIAAALSAVVLGGGGCASIAPAKLPLQEILSVALPPDFTGSAHIDHANAYVQFGLDFTGLKKVDGLWTWTGLTYKGHSAITATNISMAPEAAK